MKPTTRTWLTCSLVLLASPLMADTPLLECPLRGGGDNFTRGFYIPEFPADRLGFVELSLRTNNPVDAVVTLTARAGTYDGPLIGTAEISILADDWVPSGDQPSASDSDSETESMGSDYYHPSPFDFGGVQVVPGGTITFVLEAVSGGYMYYDVGPCFLGQSDCDLCGGEVIETLGTEPPLDSFRRASVGMTVYPTVDIPVPATSSRAAVILAAIVLAVSATVLLRRHARGVQK